MSRQGIGVPGKAASDAGRVLGCVMGGSPVPILHRWLALCYAGAAPLANVKSHLLDRAFSVYSQDSRNTHRIMSHTITSISELEALYGEVNKASLLKEADRLVPEYR